MFLPINPDTRSLRTFQRETASHQSGTTQLVQLRGKAFKTHRGSSLSIPV